LKGEPESTILNGHAIHAHSGKPRRSLGLDIGEISLSLTGEFDRAVPFVID
jgi:hypothetical protein